MKLSESRRHYWSFLVTSMAVLVPLKATALSLEFPVDKLVDSASNIVTVEINEGRVIGPSRGVCGTSYEAKIIDSLKGDSKGTIVFGSDESLAVGGSYLVVLMTKKNYIEDKEWLFQTTLSYLGDAAEANEVAKEWRSCRSSLPKKMVSAYGLGAMPIESPPELAYRVPALKVSLRIWLPPNTRCTKASSVDQHDKGIETVWIIPQEMRRVLENVLARPEGSKIVGGPGKYPISVADCEEPAKSFEQPE